MLPPDQPEAPCAGFTERCTHDQHCQRESCDAILKAGQLRYYVVSSAPGQAMSKWVCAKCNEHYIQKQQLEISTTIRRLEATQRLQAASQTSSSHRTGHRNMSSPVLSHADVGHIRNMVNIAQRKGSSQEQRMVRHLPTHIPPALSRHHPNISLPQSLGLGASTSPGPAALPSPRAIGYSPAHAYHSGATAHWRSTAYAPGDRCNILIEVHYEATGVKKVLSKRVENLSRNLSEGKDIPASMTGAQIADVAMKHMFPKLVEATPNSFTWDASRITVRDNKWKDLAGETEEGHFGKLCMKTVGKDKKLSFVHPKDPFAVLLVIDREHFAAYEDYAEAILDSTSSKTLLIASKHKGKSKSRSRASKIEKENIDEMVEATIHEETPISPLFTELKLAKRPRSDSLANPSSPPRSKRVASFVSPDRNRLRQAMAQAGGSASSHRRNKGVQEQIEFCPIKVPVLDDLMDSPSWTCSPDLIRNGTLSMHANGQLGIGTFKTCHSGTLTLDGPSLKAGLLGTVTDQEVAVKRFYIPTGAGNESRNLQQVQRYGAADEKEKTMMEANVLCWVSSLLNYGYAYIDHELEVLEANRMHKDGNRRRVKLLDKLEIPRLRFVSGGLAKQVREDSLASTATRARESAQPTATYLLEERIPSHFGFRKYINNSSATPLITNHKDPYSATALFLCSMQHILYTKSGRQLYISDFQGGGHLLTDSQVMTPANFGFADGNISSAFEAFPEQHQCNDYCLLFGLPPLM